MMDLVERRLGLRALLSAVVAIAGLICAPVAATAQAEPPPTTERLEEIAPWHVRGAAGELTVNLYFFWTHTCPHCRRAWPAVVELSEALPWLAAYELEVSGNPENAALYDALAASIGETASAVPGFLFCGELVMGFETRETTGAYLRERLTACRGRLLAGGGAAQPAEPRAPPLSIPILGTVDPAALSLPVLTVLLGGLDAFNPCAFFVLLFLLSLMVHLRSRARMALVGGTFVLISGLVYFLFMAAWLNLFMVIGHLRAVTVVAGAIAVGLAVLNIKDFFWFQRGATLSIPEGAKPRLFERMRGLLSASSLPAMLFGTVALALVANAYELLCTAGFPLVFTRVLTLHELSGLGYYAYLALYNVVYVVPLFVIVAAFTATLGTRKLSEAGGRSLKLLSGLMMLGLGALLILAPELLENILVALGLVAGAGALTLVLARRFQAVSGR
ncbi:MAG: hypothetical protein QNJ94_20880 [Alphaproteobacteria bacterium]|nr:hypothetical protein [Alphaproteobacteria bacterium]